MNRKTELLLSRCGRGPIAELLEPRRLLSETPLPVSGDLNDPANAVMRLGTEVGQIDIELFGGDAPEALAGLIARINAGDLDEAFFHSVEAGTLRTAAFRFTDGGGLRATAGVGAGGASNVAAAERTVALQPMSGELIINLEDNSADAALADAIVVGRIANDASWAVVQSIASLSTADLSGELGGSFAAVPVMDAFVSGEPLGEEDLVEMVDIELVKFQGDDAFLSEAFYYPEGFAGSTINEFLPMANPNSEAVSFQVIARFEVGQRDLVIATGTLQPMTRGGITISQFAHPELNLVPQGVPYALEVRSTLPVSVNLSHYDFGTATGETFVTEARSVWVLADGVKGTDVFDFLVWQNVTGEDAEVTVTFYPEDGSAPASIVMNTAAHRRNGLNISITDIVPDGRYSVRLESTQAIVAALTHFEPGGEGRGFTTLGASGGGSAVGVVPLATFAAGADEASTSISFLHFVPEIMDTNLIRQGTYRLGNHPDGSLAAPFYGLRLDGLFELPIEACPDGYDPARDGPNPPGHDHDHSNGLGHCDHGGGYGYGHHHDCDLPEEIPPEHFTFDFEHELSDMKLTWDGQTLRIFGSAYGGRDIGDAYAQDQFLGVYQLDFTYSAGVGSAPGDDDLIADGTNNANTGTITTPGGDVVALEDERMTMDFSFRLGNEDDDLGHRGLDGISGWGWLNHGGREHIMSSDWLFTAEFVPTEPDPAVIDLRLDFENPAIADITIPGALSLLPNTRGTVDLTQHVGDLSLLLGERFSVHYASTLPVHAGLSRADRTDGVSGATGVSAGREFLFAEGFMDPARAGVDVFETIAAYNPGLEPGDATVTIRIMYTDGFSFDIQRVVAAGETAYIDLHAESEILSQGTDNQRYFYAIQMTSNLPIVAQMDHFDLTLGGLSPSGGFTTLGTAMGGMLPLTPATPA